MREPVNTRIRLRATAWLAVITPLGFYTKFYHGPAQAWVSDYLGGAFYEVFWCLFFLLLFPRARPWAIAVPVLVATCALEFMQLWHPPILEMVRSTFLGRALIGHQFVWGDFPYYFAGTGIGWWMMSRLASS